MIDQKTIIDSIIRTTNGVKPFDLIEKYHKEKILNWLSTYPEICRQTKRPDMPNPHIAIFNVLTTPKHDKILLLEHIKSGLKLTPGGHLENGEYLQENVTRELTEEVGMKLTNFKADPLFLAMLNTTTSGEHVEFWFVIETPEDTDFTKGKDYSTEFSSHQWYTPEELYNTEKMHPHTTRFIQKFVTHYAN